MYKKFSVTVCDGFGYQTYGVTIKVKPDSTEAEDEAAVRAWCEARGENYKYVSHRTAY